jgi:hypothetical protein
MKSVVFRVDTHLSNSNGQRGGTQNRRGPSLAKRAPVG